MEFNFFLWPMIVPMLIPIFYCIFYKKQRLGEIFVITFSMILIVILYWPISLKFYSDANFYAKILLFVILPIILLFFYYKIHNFRHKSDEKFFNWKYFGINSEGLEKSLKLGLLLIPIMIGITFLIRYYLDISNGVDYILGSIYFVEAFTEEFFFRGILFLFVLNATDVRIAYITSLTSFVLMHPQQFSSILIIGTIVQGILTIEIVRRSNNLLGAWILHGFNRFFALVLIPFIL